MGVWLRGASVTVATGNNGGGWWTSNPIIATRQWHHIVVTHDGATDVEAVYVNGALIAMQGGRSIDSPNVGDLHIGNSIAYGAGAYFYNGRVSDVRLFSHTLTDAEITALYARSAPPCTDADNDGFFRESSSCGIPDCNDNDSGVFPGAAETSCDAVDQNCDGRDYCPVNVDSLIAHFKFDSDPSDSSGYRNNGTVVGAANYSAGRIDGALAFNGNTQVLVGSSPNLSLGENYSISVWVNPTTLPDWQTLVERGTSAANRLGLWLNGGRVALATGNNGGNWWTSPSVVAPNIWTHIAATHDGAANVERIFVDGVLVAQQTGRTIDTPNVGNLNIGASAAYPSSYFFRGMMDDVRIHNKALTQAEISTLVATCVTGSTRACGSSDVGQCAIGTQSCANGRWGQCLGSVEPIAEVCGDNLDNDCDGQSDCNDSECRTTYACATSVGVSFADPTPTSGSTQSSGAVTVRAALTGEQKYAFIDWNGDLRLWLTMERGASNNPADFSTADRSVDSGQDLANASGRFGNALNFDGQDDYLQIYEERNSWPLIEKTDRNPLLSPDPRFGSVWKYQDTIYLFYSNGAHVYVSSSPLSDGVNFSNHTRILNAGAEGTYDDQISGANVWEENGTWHMFYRLKTSDSNNGFGYATCSAGIACVTGSEHWQRHPDNPVDREDGLVANDYDPYGLIKVGDTYHLYANPTPRDIHHYTSQDLVNWTADDNNPIFSTDRYCPYVFKRGQYFYMLLPHDVQGFETSSGIIGNHTFELYRDTAPTFHRSSREYLGIVMTNDRAYDRYYIDTPSCVLDGIERDATDWTGSLKCYYTGNSEQWNQSSFSLDLETLDQMTRLPEGYLEDRRTVSAWIYLEDSTRSRTIFSVGYGKTDREFQEVLRVHQGKATLTWKADGATEDSVQGNTALPLRQWVHVGYVYDGSRFRIYVNGLADSAWKNGRPHFQKRNLYLGAGYSSSGYFSGRIDDVLIFARSLGESEIASLYHAGDALEMQVTGLANGTYSYRVYAVSESGQKAVTEARQVTIYAP